MVAHRIGPVLRERRLKVGWTQSRLASIAGVAQGHLSTLESGGKVATIPTLERLCSALGLALSELVTEAEAFRAKAGSDSPT